MAVFTQVNKEDLNKFLGNYTIGNLVSLNGIIEGIENSNFKVTTNKGNFILTIFEKRVNPIDLPFFMDLQKHLYLNKFDCPLPIQNKSGKTINKLHDKNAVLISFLEGKQIENPDSTHCTQVGEMIGNLINITSSFDQKRNNGLNLSKWKDIFAKCEQTKKHKFVNFIEPMQKELDYLKLNWPKSLPINIIHADLFKDNIFFKKDKLSGVIDFYFSCNDFNIYELAIAINAWCFDEKNIFSLENFKSLIKGYNKYLSLSEEEIKNFNTVIRGATMRILVTRLHDYLFHDDNAIVVPKDPNEYFEILKFHQQKSIFEL